MAGGTLQPSDDVNEIIIATKNTTPDDPMEICMRITKVSERQDEDRRGRQVG